MNKAIIAGIIGFFTFLIAVTVIFGSWYTVDQTSRGVLLRNGAVVGRAEPGLGFKMPMIDDVRKVDVSTKTFPFPKMDTYSYDQQQAYLDVSITLHAAPEKVDQLYAKFGSLENLINSIVGPVANQQTKIVFGQYTAVRAIQTRAKLNSDVEAAVTKALTDTGVINVERVQLTNIEFSKAYLQSIEQRMLAEVEVQRVQQNAEREKVQAAIAVTQAQGRADSNLAEAKAVAESIRIRGEAEASAITARAKALGENPNLVMLTQAEKWNGILPTTMVPNGAVPFISVERK